LTRIPRTLIEEITRTTSRAQKEWAVARTRGDFKRFRPWLKKIVALRRSEAEAVGYEDQPYDALLEEYEPGARGRDIALLFDALRQELVPLVNHLTHARRRPDVRVLTRAYPLEGQRKLCEHVAGAIGFDFSRGRWDTAVHPFFTSLGPHDFRIALRFKEHDFGEALFATLHEVGHALYEQGLDPSLYGTPLGEARSLGLHESQARLWENAVGRSWPFWKYFFPIAQRLFHESLHDVDVESFHFALNNVEPSLIRVGADEATYDLHILIRFELELALIAGDLDAAELPGAWNEAYRRFLGVTPKSDNEGCLQDGHWAEGLIGYFPTYTLGNIFAAQLFARAGSDLGDLDASFAAGDFGGLLGWLRDKVHRHGQRYSSAQLIERATGSPPDHRPLLIALRQKYSELYGL
jgi:carboxypeptidase Taq